MDPNNLFGLIGGSTILITLVAIACTTLPFLAIAFFLFFRARRSGSQAQNSQNWPSVLGTITASNIDISHSTNSDGGTSTSYTPRILYEYDVLGHRYRSDRINFGSVIGYGGVNSAQAIVDRYVPGNQIRVYYNPNNPGEAVLERTAGSSSRILIWVGVFILAILLCTTIVSVLAIIIPMIGVNEALKMIPALPTP